MYLGCGWRGHENIIRGDNHTSPLPCTPTEDHHTSPLPCTTTEDYHRDLLFSRNNIVYFSAPTYILLATTELRNTKLFFCLRDSAKLIEEQQQTTNSLASTQ